MLMPKFLESRLVETFKSISKEPFSLSHQFIISSVLFVLG